VLVLMESAKRNVCKWCFDAVVESDVSYSPRSVTVLTPRIKILVTICVVLHCDRRWKWDG
jgi:hypothetical protein